jgi:peptidoglycan/xylan/chitin deacetylase (PgdA/CDA1 family)
VKASRVLTLLYHDVYDSDPVESGFADSGARHYKLSQAEFERQMSGLAAVVDDAPFLATEAADPAADMPFGLTFDDGGVSFHTHIATCLEARGWRGHCFMTTGCIGQPGFLDASQLRELHARGHVIGSHSVTHPKRFASCSWEEMLKEWSDSRQTLQDILGADVVCASVPGGYFSTLVAEAAQEAGYTTLFTSEPETRVRDVGGCKVLGRHTLREGTATDLPARLARGEAMPHCRQWLVWNSKKALKTVLGAGYLRLAAHITHRR